MSRHKCKWTALTSSNHCCPHCAASCMVALSSLCCESLSSVCPAFWTGFLHLSASFATLLSSVPLLTASLILLCQPSCSFSPFDLISLYWVFKIPIGKRWAASHYRTAFQNQFRFASSEHYWLTKARGPEKLLKQNCRDILSLLAWIKWRNAISIFLYLIEFLNFDAPQYWLTLLCTSHHHIYPKKWSIPKHICFCTVVFRCWRLKTQCLDKNSVWLYFNHPYSIQDTLYFDLWLPANKKVKKIKEGNQSVKQWLRLHTAEIIVLYRKLMRKLHKELCKPEQLLAGTLLSSCSQMVCRTSKAIIHYPVKCFIYFHHAMKQMEQRGMDHMHSRGIEQKIPKTPNLFWPGFPCAYVYIKDELTQALQLKPGRKGEDFLPKIQFT